MESPEFASGIYILYVQLFCRSVLFFVFLTSILHKIRNKTKFESIIKTSIPSVSKFSGFVYYLNLLFEIVTLMLLVINEFQFHGLLLSAATLVIFSIFIAYMVRQQI